MMSMLLIRRKVKVKGLHARIDKTLDFQLPGQMFVFRIKRKFLRYGCCQITSCAVAHDGHTVGVDVVLFGVVE